MISIDPGKHGSALAEWRDGRLVSAWYEATRTHDVGSRWEQHGHLVVEWPQVYARGTTDANDLLDLTYRLGQFVQAMRPGQITRLAPREWKGQVPKKIMQARIEAQLSAEEKKRVCRPVQTALEHNVWDAIGIGLHALGRL